MKSFTYTSLCSPGQVVSLLAGAQPDPTHPFQRVLHEGDSGALTQVLAQDPARCPIGPDLILTPCEGWTALVQAFYRHCRVQGRMEGWFAGAVLQSHSAQKGPNRAKLLTQLGLTEDQAKDGLYYVFAEIPRALAAEPLDITQAKRQEVQGRYQKQAVEWAHAAGDKSEPEQLGSLLRWMGQEAGTHVIEKLWIGDRLYQVFVFEEDDYRSVCRTMDRSGWTGASALSFRFFTSPAYCRYSGRVRLLSGHPILDEIRPRMADSVYQVPESLFSALLDPSVQKDLCAADQVCCLGFEAAPMSRYLAENGNVRRSVLDQLMIQSGVARFGLSAAGPVWSRESEALPDYEKLYADFLPAAASVMRSPYTSSTAMAINLAHWVHQNTVNPDDLEHLVLTADVLIIDQDLNLSCCSDILFSCRRLICPQDTAATLTISPSAYQQFSLYCLEMTGNLILNDPSDPLHHQIVYGDLASQISPDAIGVSYTTFFRGRFPTDVFLGAEGTDLNRWRKQALQNGLQALLLSASVPVHVRNYTVQTRQTAVEAWHCLEWIRTYTGQYLDAVRTYKEQPNETMSRLFTEAVTIIRGSHDPADTTPFLPTVPVLRYTAYQETIDRLLTLSRDLQEQLVLSEQRIAQFQEQLRDSYRQEQRDENLRQLAQFMINQNAAAAQKEADMINAYNEIMDKQESLRSSLEERKKEIMRQYSSLGTQLNMKKKDLDDAIKRALEGQRAKASMEFIFGITEAVLGIVSGSFNFALLDSESTDIAKTARKWDAFLKYAEVAGKITEASETLTDYVADIKSLDEVAVDASMPTEQDWKAFLNECEVKLDVCRSLIPTETGNYLNVIKNLIDTADSLNAVIDQIAAVEREKSYQDSMKKVAQKQKDRLAALRLELNTPDWKPKQSILSDLGQMDASLQQRQMRALLMLSELVRIQDDSMTYHYLSQPTPITRFDLLSVDDALVSQAASALKTLENYPGQPTDVGPINLTFPDIAAEQLLSGEGVIIEPSMEESPFCNMARVRINSMDLRIEGLSTPSGRCHLFLETLGNPMLDRGLHRETLSYQMASRRWVVVYDTLTGQTIMNTRPAQEWGKYFTKPTPFQKIRIRLAPAKDNQGAAIQGSTTAIHLSLMLEVCPSYYEQWTRPMLEDSPTPDFIKDLQGLSITDGWDVVSFISIDKINKLWEERWLQEQNAGEAGKKQFLQNIHCHYEETPVFSTMIYDLDAELGAPKLTFNGKKADVRIPILKGKLVITERSGDQSQSKAFDCSPDADHPAYLLTQVELEKLSGTVEEASVAIQVNKGAFAFENFRISETVDVKLADMLTTFFKKEEIPPWVLGTLKTDTDIPFLKPSRFSFRTYTSEDLFDASEDHIDVLALYILTVTKEIPSYGMRRTWPKNKWVVSKDKDAAVYFSASLMWNQEIHPAMTRAIGENTVICHNTPPISWSAEFSGTKVLYESMYPIKHGYEAGGATLVQEPAVVHFPMNSITVTMSTVSIDSQCAASWKELFPYQKRTVIPDPDIQDAVLETGWDDVSFTCSYSASTRAVIDPDTFLITFKPIKASDPTVTANFPTTRPWYCSSQTVSQEIVDKAKEKIAKELTDPSINLSAMPMFAVSNLLLPQGKVMEPEAVYFPNDLVVVGTGVIAQREALTRLKKGLRAKEGQK